MRTAEWTPLQQRQVDQTRERIITIDRTWANRVTARDHYRHMEAHHVSMSTVEESPSWQACYRHIAAMYSAAARLTERRRTR